MSLKCLTRPVFRDGVTPALLAEKSMPRFDWLPVENLLVDTRYQREMGPRGLKNVRHILSHFDWNRFGVLTCVCVGPETAGGADRFAIIDGQHRATAALLHPRIDKVPCWITTASLADQARAFVEINAQVTRMTSMQMFHAAVAAGDKHAASAQWACDEAGVRVMRYPVPVDRMARGETLAAAAMLAVVKRHGAQVLRLALAALVAQDAALDVPGHVNATTVKALSDVIAQLDWQRRDRDILYAFADLPLAEIWDRASTRAHEEGGGEVRHLTEMLLALDALQELIPRATRRGRGSY